MNYAEIVRDYKACRRVSFNLGKRLVESLSTEDLQAAAKALGMLHHKRIEYEKEDELSVLMDYGIYNVFRDGRNAVGRMLEDDPPPEGSPEMRVLRAMKESHYTLLDVQTPIPGVGVRALDGPEKKPVLVVDMGFSKTAVPGMALATRILSPGEGWWMTSGAALPVNERALNTIIQKMERHRKRLGEEPDDPVLATIITRACLDAGTSRQIGYADVAESGEPDKIAPPVRTAPKVGRNDPCPCGSGKKYKKCCGS